MLSPPILNTALLAIYHDSVLIALEKQFRFDMSFRDQEWSVDLSAGKLSIIDEQTGGYVWSIQVVGTQATENSSWLWAWANKASRIPTKLLKSANQIRKFGETHRIPELTTDEQPLNGLDGHFFALVASGICQADAYFAAPYDGGTAFLLLDVPEMRNYPVPPVQRATFVIPRGLSTIPIPDHKLAIREYLNHLGLTVQERPNAFVVMEANTPVLRMDFDEQGRMNRFTALVGDIATPLSPKLKKHLPKLD